MPALKKGHISPTEQENAQILASAEADHDARPYTAEEWAKTKPRMGRPKADITKQSTTIRLSQDVMDAFKASGTGWQTRIDNALKDWLKTHRVG